MRRITSNRLPLGLLGLLGLAAAGPAARAATITVTQPTPITIPTLGTATPYPSTIILSGASGLTHVSVTLNGFSHTSPSDVATLLVGPTGARTFLMDGAGGFNPVSDLTLTFDDAGPLPPAFGPLMSGTYRPSTFFPGDVLPPPAPPPPYASPPRLSIFDGTDPNGVWSLYVFDFIGPNSGSISGGWSLTLTVATVPEPSTLTLFGLSATGLLAYGWRRRQKRA
jgi:hypothetical protein